uniref:Glycine-rich protein n=1 Tax=Kalanchoe fedtschenkoi TaxID=63787 RepID=A0A7N0U950_KALFE
MERVKMICVVGLLLVVVAGARGAAGGRDLEEKRAVDEPAGLGGLGKGFGGGFGGPGGLGGGGFGGPGFDSGGFGGPGFGGFGGGGDGGGYGKGGGGDCGGGGYWGPGGGGKGYGGHKRNVMNQLKEGRKAEAGAGATDGSP